MRKHLPLFLLLLLIAPASNAALYVTVVQGLGGMPEFDDKFHEQMRKISTASATMTEESMVTAFAGEAASREALLAHFTALADIMSDDDRAAIYLIGHGSHDGEHYKFNIPGPDITDTDLGEILGSLPGSNHFLLSTSSSSGAILDTLELGDRIVITATRNGNEKNATEFGDFFAESLSSDTADINKNNNVSIQEAFDYAERSVAEFFENQGKLATEHPQIRGDGASSFSIARLGSDDTNIDDPRINTLLTRSQALESEIESLQLRRNEYSNADYIQQLQALVLESAQISEQIDLLREGAEADVD